MSSERGGTAVDTEENMDDSMESESDIYVKAEGNAKRPKKKCAALKRKGTGVKKIQGGSLAARKANLSLNTSIVRQTLRSNNRSLARALEIARLEMSNLQRENDELKAQQVKQERNVKKRLGEVHDVASLVRDKLLSSVSLIEVLQSMCTDEFALDQTMIANSEVQETPKTDFQAPALNNVDQLEPRANDALEVDSEENTLAERLSVERAEELQNKADVPSTDIPVVETHELMKSASSVVEAASSIQLDVPVLKPPPSVTTLELSTVMEKSYFNDDIPFLFADESASRSRGSGDGVSKQIKPRGHSRSRSGRRSALIYQSSNVDPEGTRDVEEQGPRRSLRARSKSRRHTKTSFGQDEQCVVEEKPGDLSVDQINIATELEEKELKGKSKKDAKNSMVSEESTESGSSRVRQSLTPEDNNFSEDANMLEKGEVEDENVFKPKKEIPRTPPSRRTSQETSLEEPEAELNTQEDHIVQLPRFIAVDVVSSKPKRISPGKAVNSNIKNMSNRREPQQNDKKAKTDKEKKEDSNVDAEKSEKVEAEGQQFSPDAPKQDISEKHKIIITEPEVGIPLEDDDATIIMNYNLTSADVVEKTEKMSVSPSQGDREVRKEGSDLETKGLETSPSSSELVEKESMSKSPLQPIVNKYELTKESDLTESKEKTKVSQEDQGTHAEEKRVKALKMKKKSRVKQGPEVEQHEEIEVNEIVGEEEIPPKRISQRRSRAHLRRGTYCMSEETNEESATITRVNTDKEPVIKEQRQRRGTYDLQTEEKTNEVNEEEEILPKRISRRGSRAHLRRGTFCLSEQKTLEAENVEVEIPNDMLSNKDRKQRRGTYALKPELDEAKAAASPSRGTQKTHGRRGTFCLRKEDEEILDLDDVDDIMDEVGDNLIDDIEPYSEEEPIPQAEPSLEPPSPQSYGHTVYLDEDMDMTEPNRCHISIFKNPDESTKNKKKMRAVPKKVRRVVSKEEKSKARARKDDTRKDQNMKPVKEVVHRAEADREEDADFESDEYIKSRHKKKDFSDDDVFKKPEVPFKPPKNMISVRKSKSSSNSSSDSDSTETEKEKAKFTAWMGRPGQIVFTAGRKNIDPSKANQENITKPKARSKSKIKSMLPRPGKPRSKSSQSKTRLLSLEKEMKTASLKEKAAKADDGQVKSVFDMSLNESLTVLPQMSYTDFREQNPAMAEMKEALKNNGKSEAAGVCSPHGIMLVVRNGKRTKPRMRSKSVSYAKKLAEVHLRTPSRSSDDSTVSYLSAAAGHTPPRKKEGAKDNGVDSVDLPCIVPETPNCTTPNMSSSEGNLAREKYKNWVNESPFVSSKVNECETKSGRSKAREGVAEFECRKESVQETPPPATKPTKVEKKMKPPKINIEKEDDEPVTLNVGRERTSVMSKVEVEQDSTEESERDDSFIPSSQEDQGVSNKKSSKTANLMKKLKVMRQKTLALSMSTLSTTDAPAPDVSPMSGKRGKQTEQEAATPRSSARKRSAARPAEKSDKQDTEDDQMRDSKRSLAQQEFLTNLDRVPEVKRSRRAASSSVSYKEPSLNTKMRRDGRSSDSKKVKPDTKKRSTKKTSRGALSTITNTETVDAT